MKRKIDKNLKVCIVGLGYVGLPLSIEFAKKFKVLGFDLDEKRVSDLQAGTDASGELTKEQIISPNMLSFSSDIADLSKQDVYIIAVPTPVDGANKPDLSILMAATAMVASAMPRGALIVIESTVYPGVTDDVLVPLIEKASRYRVNHGFYVGYSPERINPADPTRGVADIIKITAGTDMATGKFVDDLYASIITAGTFRASSIRVAEAAKVLENVQRDVNIALMNEVSFLFNKIGISTRDVLEAANTKWNFVPVKPGLVGGHCIAVDPHYLTDLASQLGVDLPVVTQARKMNHDTPAKIALIISDFFTGVGRDPKKCKLLILGFAFKGDCSDIRNTGVFSLLENLRKDGFEVAIHDPEVSAKKVKAEYGLALTAEPPLDQYDGIIIAVDHSAFKSLGLKAIKKYGNAGALVFDLKAIFRAGDVDFQL